MTSMLVVTNVLVFVAMLAIWSFWSQSAVRHSLFEIAILPRSINGRGFCAIVNRGKVEYTLERSSLSVVLSHSGRKAVVFSLGMDSSTEVHRCRIINFGRDIDALMGRLSALAEYGVPEGSRHYEAGVPTGTEF